MSIARPTTKTIISTTGWGIPITDEVNRLTTVTTVTDIREYWKNGSNQTYPGTNLPISFPTRRDTLCSTGTTLTKNGNYFIIATAGLYIFQYYAQWAAAASTSSCAAWLHTSANNERFAASQITTRTDGDANGNGTVALKVAANTQIGVCVYSTSGAGTISTCEFSAVLIRKD